MTLHKGWRMLINTPVTRLKTEGQVTLVTSQQQSTSHASVLWVCCGAIVSIQAIRRYLTVQGRDPLHV
jgi:hypothetical protein